MNRSREVQINHGNSSFSHYFVIQNMKPRTLHQLHSQSFTWFICFLLLGPQSSAERIEENTACAPAPFRIFPRDMKSLLMFSSLLVVASVVAMWKSRNEWWSPGLTKLGILLVVSLIQAPGQAANLSREIVTWAPQCLSETNLHLPTPSMLICSVHTFFL